MKKTILLLFLLLPLVLFAGLRKTTSKQLLLIAENKADSTFWMAYEHDLNGKVIVDWEKAEKDANTKCKLWGYNKSKFSKRTRRKCLEYSQDGIYCEKQEVIYECKCSEKTEE